MMNTSHKELARALKELYQSTGWELLSREFKRAQKAIERDIIHTRFDDLREIDDLQLQRKYIMKLLEMPKVLMNYYLSREDEQEPFDPFYEEPEDDPFQPEA